VKPSSLNPDGEKRKRRAADRKIQGLADSHSRVCHQTISKQQWTAHLHSPALAWQRVPATQRPTSSLLKEAQGEPLWLEDPV
jgi:hypothetical protein